MSGGQHALRPVDVVLVSAGAERVGRSACPVLAHRQIRGAEVDGDGRIWIDYD
ncbi:hypothetical protein [Streptomyces sp. KN37]|uniref:hypothetical protein n=1 Tax=Streptomyces sp. KN37 TaxID=3090667 RepID=UPI002A74C8E1|nr:hypothetical protein [Streptomyces sp. KN37]WPO76278.1 hypothetical protein R9806_37000 [Streptomyces sp. KN37]